MGTSFAEKGPAPRTFSAVSASRKSRCHMVKRDYMHSLSSERVDLDELAKASSRNHWNLARDFRQVFGTRPSRFMTLRRLDNTKRLMFDGIPLAECAALASFSDQSHMTR
jgi:AraC-like DNA-binding protein